MQDEIKRRKAIGRAYSSKSIFGAKLKCGDCGGWFGVKTWHSTDRYRTSIWQCNCKFDKGKNRCKTPHLTEEEIEARFIAAYNSMLTDKSAYLLGCETAREFLMDTTDLDTEMEELLRELDVIAGLIRKCIDENSATAQDQTEYTSRYNAYVDRYYTFTGKAFHVHGQTYDKNTKSSYDFPISGSIWYIRDQAFGQYLNYNVRKWIADETAVPADAAGLRMTPVEARKLVEAFWADNGFEDMVVIGVYLTRNSDTGNGGDRKVPDPYGDNSAYVVACGKSIDGILPPPPSSGDPHWAFESCTFTITDNGIETFNWGSPYAYGEYTTKNSALLTFDKVDEIFQKMMLVKYDISGSGNDLTSATYKVDRVTLEMSRVTNRKSSEKGLLVPVWNFYGSYYFTYEDGHNFGSDDREGFPSPLLRINAIDGSIIEARYGC